MIIKKNINIEQLVCVDNFFFFNFSVLVCSSLVAALTSCHIRSIELLQG